MDSKIVDRIQKLLALASSDNENEAAVAAAQAARLMREHKIEQAQLDAASPNANRPAEEPSENSFFDGPATPWRQRLAQAAAHAHDCRVFMQSLSSRTKSLRIFGLKSDVQAAAYTFAYLARTIDSVTSREADTSRGYRNAFRLGMATRLYFRLEEAKQSHERELEVTASGAALVLVKRDALRVQSAYERYRQATGMHAGREHTVSNSGGYYAGQAAAESVQLHGAKALQA